MINGNETLELLSILLSEENPTKTLYTELYEKLFLAVTQDISEQLNKSTYPQKSKFISNLKSVLERSEIFTQFPELVGKTVVSVLETKGEVNDTILDKLSLSESSKLYKYATNVPTIITHCDTEDNIRVFNSLENIVSISKYNFKNTCNELYKRKLDIRQFLYAFSVSAKLPYPNIAYINLPFYTLKSQEYSINLMKLVDIFIIPVDQEDKWKYNLKFAKHHGRYKDIYIIAKDEDISSVQNYIDSYKNPSYSINTCTMDRLEELLKSQNHIRNNGDIKESFLNVINKFYIYQINRLNYLEDIICSINRDLIKIEDKDTGESIREIKEEILHSIEKEREVHCNFKTTIQEIINLINQFENSLYQVASIETSYLTDLDTLYYNSYEENLSKLIIDLIEIGDFPLANTYIYNLKLRKCPYTYIFELYMDSQMNRELSYANLKKLKIDKSMNNIVLKSKVKFGAHLKLSKDEVFEYVKLLEKPLDPYESYVLGNYYSKIDRVKAKFFYEKSLEEGYKNAGNELIKYIDVDNHLELKKLANMLIPEANYLYAVKCLEDNKYAQGITNLKIATILKHDKAIERLADIEYYNGFDRYKIDDIRKDKSINIAFQLYQYLLDKNPENIIYIERLGDIYYYKEDYRRSRKLLEKCHTPNALYKCGWMYRRGEGVAKDLIKARDLLKSALQKGHKEAEKELGMLFIEVLIKNIKIHSNKDKDYSTVRTYKKVEKKRKWWFRKK